LWNYVERVTALTMLGDRWQMGSMGGSNPWDSPAFTTANCYITKLVQPFRCEDEAYWKLLNGIRTTRPTKTCTGRAVSVPDLMRNRRAWRGATPSLADIQRLRQAHPEATFLAVTRKGTQLLNELAVESEYGHLHPLVVLPGDVEANPDNYVGGKLKPSRALVPMPVPVYVGMQVYITRNLDKEMDSVNGMKCTVEGYHAASCGLRLLTATGQRVTLWNWTDMYLGGVTYYPVRPGYASTILKFQGAELPFVVLYLDGRAPGAAYTAMSRVKLGAQCLIGGNCDPDHFLPANHKFTYH
jgi:hypothetical protein